MGDLKERAFEYIPVMPRSGKPRDRGITQVRDIKGRGMAEMEDICQTAGEFIDVYKMACATQRLLPKEIVKKKIDLCHRNGIEVSTGGYLERVLLAGPDIVKRFLKDSKEMGFDIVEISTGLVYMPLEDKMNLIQYTRDLGLKPHPEISASYGIHEEAEVQVSTDLLIQEIEQALKAGAWKVLVEEEGLTENVKEKRFDVLGKIASAFDTRKLIFEACEPEVFNWYLSKLGPEVNLHVDAEWVLYIEAIRRGAWGKSDTWGRAATFSA